MNSKFVNRPNNIKSSFLKKAFNFKHRNTTSYLIYLASHIQKCISKIKTALSDSNDNYYYKSYNDEISNKDMTDYILIATRRTFR